MIHRCMKELPQVMDESRSSNTTSAFRLKLDTRRVRHSTEEGAVQPAHQPACFKIAAVNI
jgi:hypothetical protein